MSSGMQLLVLVSSILALLIAIIWLVHRQSATSHLRISRRKWRGSNPPAFSKRGGKL